MQNGKPTKREHRLYFKPTATLDPGKIKCLSNIPAGYCMVVDTLGQVPCRPVGHPAARIIALRWYLSRQEQAFMGRALNDVR